MARGRYGAGLWLALTALYRRVVSDDDAERGDVPGWVMITLMSAVLVAGLLALAGPALQGLFQAAIGQVSP
ncbi:hypothetical protein ACX80W_05135 [Arthrobacter sp. TMN-37]